MKINELPTHFIRYDKMSYFKRTLEDADYRHLKATLELDLEFWNDYVKGFKPLDYFVAVLNKAGVKFAFENQSLFTFTEFDIITLTECHSRKYPFLLGYILLERDQRLNRYNRQNRYIRVIHSTLKRSGIATAMLQKYQKKLKKDLFPLGIIQPAYSFWYVWFYKRHKISRTHQYLALNKKFNLSYDCEWCGFLKYIEKATEHMENAEMGQEDRRA